MDQAIIDEIERRAEQYVKDNYVLPAPSDWVHIQNAMLIGASIIFEEQSRYFSVPK